MNTLLKDLKFEVERRARRRSHQGVRYHCPLCDSQVSKMLSHGRRSPIFDEYEVVGAGHRLNAVCPVCGCTDRARLVFLYLKLCTKIFHEPLKVLHVAPEPGLERILTKLAHLEYLTADLHSPNAMVHMDITNIGYPDNSFDVIICNHVLEQVHDDALAMSELHRVLRPGGWAVLQVPLCYDLAVTIEDSTLVTEEKRFKAFGQRGHMRIYGRDYGKRLAHAGFEVDCFDWTRLRDHFGGVKNLHSLIEAENVFVGHKV